MQNRAGLVKKGVRFLPITTLFSWYLGGVTAVDSSWASVTQLMDSKKRKWSREILRALGIPAWLMPEIVAPGTPVGEIRAGLADAVGLNRARSSPWAPTTRQAPTRRPPWGTPANALIISSGTWSLVGKLVRKPVTSEEAMAANISNEGGIGNIRLLKNCMGTWLVQELRRAWRARDGRELDWEEMNRLTEKGTPFAAFIDPDDPELLQPAEHGGGHRRFLPQDGAGGAAGTGHDAARRL